MLMTQKRLPLLHMCTQSSFSQSTPHSDARQQFTCFRSKLFCCQVPSGPSVTRVTQRLFSWFASFGRLFFLYQSHPLHPSSDALEKDWLMPTKATTLQVETPLLSCTKAWCFYSWDNRGIRLQTILQIAPHILWNQDYTMHKKSHDILNYTMHI